MTPSVRGPKPVVVVVGVLVFLVAARAGVQAPAAGAGTPSTSAGFTESGVAAAGAGAVPPGSTTAARAPSTGGTSLTTPEYPVTFVESGLPPGTVWSVVLTVTNSSATDSISFSVAPGSYIFAIGTIGTRVPVPSLGWLNVTDGPVVQTISFQPGYQVTFDETGLPVGTLWGVSLDGTAIDSASSMAVVTLLAANGTYNFTSLTLDRCFLNPPVGSLTVDGAPVIEDVEFVPAQFPVVFQEVGLPPGVNWTVTFDDATQQATAGGTIEFSASCGLYRYTLGPVDGYTTPLQGSPYVQLSGSSYGTVVPFEPAPGVLGLPGSTGQSVIGTLLVLTSALVAAGAFVRTWFSRGGKR